jgi:hypothetical protein
VAKHFLLDLIKNVQNPKSEEVSFLEAANEFMIGEASIGREDPDWADRPDLWHPSSLSYSAICPRLEIFKRLRPDLVKPARLHPPSLMRIFKIGTALHGMYQGEIWGRMKILWGCWADVLTLERPRKDWTLHFGFMPNDDWVIEGVLRRWVHVELAVYNKRYNIGGHIDGILCPNGDVSRGYVADLKSSNSHGFNNTDVVRDYHYKQVQIYLHCDPIIPRDVTLPTIVGGMVWMVNKDTAEEKEFFFEKDSAPLQGILRNVDLVNSSIAANKLPGRVKACGSNRTSKAKACLACDVCFRTGTGRQGMLGLKRLEQPNE